MFNVATTEEILKLVGIYARVSSDDQQERETIENQVDFANKYCDLHKIDIVDWYKDDGVSGTIPLEERPEGMRLIEDAKAGKIKVLLIYNIKRLGRTARHILNSVYMLEQYGVVIKSMTEPFDTSTSTGRFMLTILAGVAELDRETTLENLWLGANRAARKGKWLGGIVPYGYRVNDQNYLEVSEDPLPGKPDMSEADVIRLIYSLTTNHGWSTIKIADYLNSLQVPPSYIKDGRKVTRGKRKENTAGIWRPGRVRNMIVNPTYKGVHEYGKRSKKEREIIKREVPAIVSPEVWDRAQEVLRENQIEALKNATRPYLLRSLIKCGACGLTYVGNKFPSTGRRLKAYYVCSGKTIYRGPLDGKCRSKNLPAEWIEELVWNECVEFIMNPGEAIKELSANIEGVKNNTADLKTELEMIKKSLRDKESERHQILTLYRQKVITAADVEKQLQDMMTESQVLESRIKELNQQIENEEGMVKDFDSAEQLLLSLREKLDNPTFEDRRAIIKTLVSEIIVETEHPPDGTFARPKTNVRVRYAFRTPEVLSSRLPLRLCRRPSSH